MVKKRLMAILLAVSMIASGASASVVHAEDVSPVEEAVEDSDNASDAAVDSEVEGQEPIEGETEEGVADEVPSDELSVEEESEELIEEDFEEEIEEAFNNRYEGGYVTTMDENGNVYEVIAEDGDASDIAAPFGIATFAARSMSGKIVNFNTKGSGVTNYTEYQTGFISDILPLYPICDIMKTAEVII